MDLIRTRLPIESATRDAAVVIGNFDGLHLGHRALIERMHALAKPLGLVPSLLCFEPLPATVFDPTHPVRHLMSVRDKIIHCQHLGIERLLMRPFNHAFAALSPEVFVDQVIVQQARACQIIVGEDFRFGAKAQGDVDLLISLGAKKGFEVHPVAAVEQFGERISSTRLRDRLGQGDLETAEKMLGRPYAMSGRVLRGQQLGRQLGFPTVNIRPPLPPALRGVFAVRVSADERKGPQNHPGVASLGLRPTVGGKNWLLEVHLFDYDDSLYGQHLTVEFEAFIRAEEKFDSLDAMVEQMHHDADQARAHLSASGK